ncbi:hypothetical protein GQ42DRAFT_161827 [Ramicandelaber brevisporus]|nr:hypothetical protein GQ42DRAFT_161827 [Ramicandelaber brevisporus]
MASNPRVRPTDDRDGWRGIDHVLVSFAANLIAESIVVIGLNLWATTSYIRKIPGTEWTSAARYINAEGFIMFFASTILLLAAIAMGKRSEYRLKNRPIAPNSKFIAAHRWPRFLQSSGGMVLYMFFFGCWHMIGVGLSWKLYGDECSAGAPGRLSPLDGDSPQSPCRAVGIAAIWHTVGGGIWLVFAGVAYIVHKVTKKLEQKFERQIELDNLNLEL